MVWIGNILWAIGASLESGSNESILYENIEGKEGHSFKKVLGKSIGYRLAAIAVGSLLVTPLSMLSLRTPIVLSVPFVCIPFFAILLFKEERIARHPYSARTHINTIVNGILHVYRSREIRWIISFGIILGCVAKIWFFSYNPYFELVHIPIKWFGVIFCVMNCIAWISSTYAESIEQHIGERNSILLLFSVITLPVICMGVFVHPALAAMVLLPNIMRGFIRPFKSDYINRRIGNEARSTILSTESAIVQLSGVISLYLFGIVLDHTSLPNALVILGLVALVLSYLNFKSYRKLAFVPH